MLYKLYIWYFGQYVGISGLFTLDQIPDVLLSCSSVKYFTLPFGISRDSEGNPIDKCFSAVSGRASLVSLGAKREGRGNKTQTL